MARQFGSLEKMPKKMAGGSSDRDFDLQVFEDHRFDSVIVRFGGDAQVPALITA
jgi:hypothetical protein